MRVQLCVVGVLAVILHAGAAVDISGAWMLDVGKSVWGTRPKPVSVTLQVQHREPALEYSGVVIYSGEDARPFNFSGAIDGKPYHMDRSFGAGSVVLHRTDTLTFESIFKTSDGRSVETTTTTISGDGRTLTRRIRLQSGRVTSVSTEVYHRN